MKSRIWLSVVVFCAFTLSASALEYYLPHVTYGQYPGGGMRNTFVFFNVKDRPVSASFSLTTDSGAPMTVTIPGRGTASTFDLGSLKAGQTLILQTDEGAGLPLVAGACTVTSSEEIGVGGVFSVYGATGNFQTEAGVGRSEPQSKFYIPVNVSGDAGVGFAMFNPSSQAANVTVRLYQTSGTSTLAPASFTLGAKNHKSQFFTGPGQLFPSLTGFQGIAEIQSDQPVAAVALLWNPQSATLSTLPAAPSTTADIRFNLPHLANGTFAENMFYNTSFYIFNISDRAAMGALTLTDSAAMPFPVTINGIKLPVFPINALAAKGSLFWTTDGSGALGVGAGVVQSNVPLGVALIFSVVSNGVTSTAAGVLPAASLSEFTLPADMTGSLDTGVAIFNSGVATATVTARFLDEDGNLVATATPIDLAVKQQIPKFASQLFPAVGKVRGSISFTSTGPVSAVALRVYSSPLCISTLPVQAGAYKGTTPTPTSSALLGKERTGVTATSNVTVDEQLAAGFVLSGKVSGPVQSVSVVIATSGTSVYSGPVDPTTWRYAVVLPAGAYSLSALYTPTIPGFFGAPFMTYNDPAAVSVSADATRDIAIPSVPTYSVTGAVTGLENLPPNGGQSIQFVSNDMKTRASSFADPESGTLMGAYLPNGAYTGSLMTFTSDETTTMLFRDLVAFNVSGAPVTDLVIPAPATTTVSGTVQVGGLGTFPDGSLIYFSNAPLSSLLADMYSVGGSAITVGPSGGYAGFVADKKTYYSAVSVQYLTDGSLFFPYPMQAISVSGSTVFNLNLGTPPPAVTVSGRVTGPDGKGVANVAVSAFSTSLSGIGAAFTIDTTTDSNGNYSFSVISGTGYILGFTPPLPKS